MWEQRDRCGSSGSICLANYPRVDCYDLLPISRPSGWTLYMGIWSRSCPLNGNFISVKRFLFRSSWVFEGMSLLDFCVESLDFVVDAYKTIGYSSLAKMTSCSLHEMENIPFQLRTCTALRQRVYFIPIFNISDIKTQHHRSRKFWCVAARLENITQLVCHK